MSRGNTNTVEYEKLRKLSQTLDDVSSVGGITLNQLHLAELANIINLFGWAANAAEWNYIQALLLKAKAGSSAFQNYHKLAGLVISSKNASLRSAMKETSIERRKRAGAPPSTVEPFTRIDGVLAFIISAAIDVKSCMVQIDELRSVESTRPLSRQEYTLLDDSRQLLLR